MEESMVENISLVAGILLFLAITIYWQRSAIKKLKKQEGSHIQSDIQQQLGIQEGTHLLYFYSKSCAACRSMSPIIDELAHDQKHSPNTGESRPQATIHKLDVGDHYQLARNFGVMATPTTVITKNGEVTLIEVGAKKKEKLEKAMGV